MKRLLITGGTGFLGGVLVAMACREWETFATYCASPIDESLPVEWLQLDLRNQTETRDLVTQIKPDVIIHAAALTSSSLCEKARQTARQVNVVGTGHMVRAAELTKSRLIYTSTDMVFGRGGGFRGEEAAPEPVSWYGRTKFEAERIVGSSRSNHCIVRVALTYGLSVNRARCFTENMILNLKNGVPQRLFADEYRTPVYAHNLCQLILKLAERNELRGLFHIGGPERLSRYDLGLQVCRVFGFSEDLLVPVSAKDAHMEYDRPADCSLSSDKLIKALGTRIWSVKEGLEHMKFRPENTSC